MSISIEIMRKIYCSVNKILSFLVIIVVLVSCSDKKEKDVVRSYWDNGNLKSELRYKDGKLNGDCFWYFSNGRPDMKAHYDMNVMEGEVLRWYENGNIQSRYYIKKDQYDSIFESYNVFGNLVKIEHYKEGVLHGEYKQWYDSGKLFMEGAYNEGMLHGKWMVYYEGGAVGSVATYENGAGLQKGYSPDGTLITEINYKDNVRDGNEIQYNRDGSVKEILVWDSGEFVKTINK